MFNLSTFIYNGLVDGINNRVSAFVISERAGNWLMRGILTDEQMVQIQLLLEERDKPKDEPIDEGMTLPENEMPQESTL